MPLLQKVPDVTKDQIWDFAVVQLMPTRDIPTLHVSMLFTPHPLYNNIVVVQTNFLDKIIQINQV